ncbi:NDP-sugar epimerase [Thermoplasma volcanium GSS1]|uniref:dTDP-4-dehydrorhamnose 3,5-epimerase n=1 Tax=Thermoplasma volcanium (strain ATCC 51530 / DSM 4299 / JCM 9571 / NBRC 15438 / GSS1) TaxID=273116 RepID=Q97A89_THEVO|nr:dTDP-4-dehydrorhamnose 3,5-epimerase [Thermoplasma volcanium]BAB60063.1 NDP-sugar epimerase [Thermoplasma volcanium GSS1]
MTFIFEETEIPDVIHIVCNRYEDNRGYFEERYKASEFDRILHVRFVQDNHSFSRRGVIRGLHFQREPMAQGKLVGVITGRIYDVAVDLRKDSVTFGKWVYRVLSNNEMLWIPRGFAHGFQALEDSHVVYKVDNEFSRQHEDGIIFNDPDLAIDWPIKDPIVSEKDIKLGTFRNFRGSSK